MPGREAVGARAARLIVLRHGSTTWSRSGRFTGHQDPPLDDAGRAQARAAAAALAARPIRRIVSSDLRRAVQTAEILAEAVGLPVVPDRRLREEYLGQWEGRTAAEVSQLLPDGYLRWQRGEVLDPFDGREGLTAVARRVLPAAADAILPDTAANPPTVLLVTHVNAALALTGSLTGTAPCTWPHLAAPEPGTWVELRMDACGPGAPPSVSAHARRGDADLGVARARPGERDVVPQRPVEHGRILGDVGDLAAQVRLAQPGDVLTTDEDAAVVDVHEPQQQPEQGALPATGTADETDLGAAGGR